MVQRLAAAGRNVLLASALIFAACTEVTEPAGPVPTIQDPPHTLASVTCTATLSSRTVTCGQLSGLGAQAAVIIGGQGQYVQLTSSNITIQADTFAFDVTVWNLIEQQLGTIHHNHPELPLDPSGIRVFFRAPPVPGGGTGGTVTVANADGSAAFTSGSQPYFQYDVVLRNGQVSASKRWKLRFTPEVTTFTFQVFVSAKVAFPDGYVSGMPYLLMLNPGETIDLSATVFSMVGHPLVGEAIKFISYDRSIVSVSGSQATAGTRTGLTNIYAHSSTRPSFYLTTVSVCPATVVGHGTIISGSITESDCYSALTPPGGGGGPLGLPVRRFLADVFRVTLTAGQTITVDMLSSDVVDMKPSLRMTNPLAVLVASSVSSRCSLALDDARIEYTATESGVFVFEASTEFSDHVHRGDDTLMVNIPAGPCPSE